MPSVLFVCTQNRYRSPIAAECFRAELRQSAAGADWVVGSAGTWTQPGLPASVDAVADARALGLDVHSHRSTPISAELMTIYDLILVMERGHKEALQLEFPRFIGKIFLLSEVAEGVEYDIPDPYERDEEQQIAAELARIVRSGFTKICARVNNLTR